jgi:hypothetical protein
MAIFDPLPSFNRSARPTAFIGFTNVGTSHCRSRVVRGIRSLDVVVVTCSSGNRAASNPLQEAVGPYCSKRRVSWIFPWVRRWKPFRGRHLSLATTFYFIGSIQALVMVVVTYNGHFGRPSCRILFCLDRASKTVTLDLDGNPQEVHLLTAGSQKKGERLSEMISKAILLVSVILLSGAVRVNRPGGRVLHLPLSQ